ncbi:MAG: plastocyanin/azurin family copper-binding protein [Verrucomicrobiales bacterium]|nr:hypothetical protein [Verrucomicrobiae bacterium]MCP5554117.1 hypothetical protein [Akkermansiaceae bacterium]
MTKITALSSLFALVAAVGGTALLKAQDVSEIKLTADKITFAYDLKEFSVKAGQKVKISFTNPADSVNLQPHNMLILKPGKKEAVGALANAGLSDPNFLTTKNCIPDSEDILHHTNLLKPGETGTLEFTAPAEAGDYPYICTYPGHWILMNGVMHVTP